jgi:hypothetical protein
MSFTVGPRHMFTLKNCQKESFSIISEQVCMDQRQIAACHLIHNLATTLSERQYKPSLGRIVATEYTTLWQVQWQWQNRRIMSSSWYKSFSCLVTSYWQSASDFIRTTVTLWTSIHFYLPVLLSELLSTLGAHPICKQENVRKKFRSSHWLIQKHLIHYISIPQFNILKDRDTPDSFILQRERTGRGGGPQTWNLKCRLSIHK